MAAIGLLLRLFSYLYHFVLGLFLLAISGLVLIGEGYPLDLDMLPWKGRTLVHWVFFSSLAGLITMVLAWKGRLRFLYFLYTLAVFVMIFRGYFLGPYTFSGKEGFHAVLYLTAGALLAVFGGWSQMRKKDGRSR